MNACLATLMLLMALAPLAQLGRGLPPEVRRQLHTDIRMATVRFMPADGDAIWALRENPRSVQIVSVGGSSGLNLQSAQVDALARWVEGGGTLWLRTGGGSSALSASGRDLAQRLGMRIEPAPGYCNRLEAGGASHPVLNNVRSLYAAHGCQTIHLGASAVPLLTTEGRITASLATHGGGMVFVFPYGLESQLASDDNERFLVNVREFSAGYPVP